MLLFSFFSGVYLYVFVFKCTQLCFSSKWMHENKSTHRTIETFLAPWSPRFRSEVNGKSFASQQPVIPPRYSIKQWEELSFHCCLSGCNLQHSYTCATPFWVASPWQGPAWQSGKPSMVRCLLKNLLVANTFALIYNSMGYNTLFLKKNIFLLFAIYFIFAVFIFSVVTLGNIAAIKAKRHQREQKNNVNNNNNKNGKKKKNNRKKYNNWKGHTKCVPNYEHYGNRICAEYFLLSHISVQ